MAILKLRLGVHVRRRNTGGMFYTKKSGKRGYVEFNETGSSDYWFIYQGRHCEMEYKIPGRIPSMDQIRYMQEINAEGGYAFWADDWPVIDRKIIPGLVRQGRIVMRDNGEYDIEI